MTRWSSILNAHTYTFVIRQSHHWRMTSLRSMGKMDVTYTCQLVPVLALNQIPRPDIEQKLSQNSGIHRTAGLHVVGKRRVPAIRYIVLQKISVWTALSILTILFRNGVLILQ